MEWLFLIVLAVLMLLQAPVWVAVGLSAFVGLMVSGFQASTAMYQALMNVNSFALLAVPFYVYSGNLMSKGSIAKEILNTAQALLGGKRESIGIATIVAMAFFAAIAGSSVVTIAALGPLTIPMMQAQGYKRSYACAIAATGAVVGPIIPPSLTMVLYGVQNKVSITDLFMGGVIPGLMISASLIITLLITRKKNIDYSVELPPEFMNLTIGQKLKVVWDSKWSLLMPVIVLGGIYGGIVTPTEAAVVASVYAIIVGLFIKRDMTLKMCLDLMIPTTVSTGAVMVLVAVSAGFGSCLTLNMIPHAVATGVTSISESPIVILFLITLVGLITGCFMEGTAALILLSPILLPLATQCGMTPLEFGIAFCSNISIGTVTPPFGVNLFVATSVSGESITNVIKSVWPFIIAIVIVLLIMMYVPQISSFLPTLLNG